MADPPRFPGPTSKLESSPPSTSQERLQIDISGAVQGVGFRPFVHRIATQLGLSGYVRNTPSGARIEVQGPRELIDLFREHLVSEAPPHAFYRSVTARGVEVIPASLFEIRQSTSLGKVSAIVLPDLAACSMCLAECRDPKDRRYRYPFLNCTNCGPRYSIVLSLPYDRARTVMARFPLCDSCRGEYEDPRNRRFHAQPTACPRCGPALELWDSKGQVLARGDTAFFETVAALRAGRPVAVKGLGGFHLMVDACNSEAVRELRRRKNREEKPFAVMVSSLVAAREIASISALEEELLASPQAPIVLVARANKTALAPEVAPRNPNLGLFLPYTPLHHMLLDELGGPAVATSGNLSDEPICTDEKEALKRLGSVAGLFLVHDRPIARPVDDSVLRVIGGKPVFFRRARGYAPFPVFTGPLPPLLAAGAHQKVTIAVSSGTNVFLSQHIGDMGGSEARAAFEETVRDLPALYGVTPRALVTDAHPGYATVQWSKSQTTPSLEVQHHEAHIHSVLAETGFQGHALGLAWDGTGYGPDGTVWGGEFFRVENQTLTRIGRFRPFPLPGGEKAVKEPRRAAAGLLFEILGPGGLDQIWSFSPQERRVLTAMLERGVSVFRTSSVGRLFDAVAALLDLRQLGTFEGQPAMDVEFAAMETLTPIPLEFSIEPCKTRDGGLEFEVNWASAVTTLLSEQKLGTSAASLARGFHEGLSSLATRVAVRDGASTLILSGGCFQNALLSELIIMKASERGLRVLRNLLVPPNDGGISLGQINAAANKLTIPE